jgi:hypothetical protein
VLFIASGPAVIRGGCMSVLMAARPALICHCRVVAAVL